MVNIGSTSTGGRVVGVKADLAKILLTSPACTEIDEKIALSRRIDKHWRYAIYLICAINNSSNTHNSRVIFTSNVLFSYIRLIGWGKIKRGTTIEPDA